MLRRVLVSLVALLMLLGVTACGGGGGGGGSASPGNDTLIIGAAGLTPRTLNPAVQSGVATTAPGAQLFASPVYFTDTFEPKPYLATSWEFSDDNLALTLHLAEDATFHDGKPVTSEDLAFSLDVVKKNHPFGNALFGTVTAVDTPDEHTAVIRLSRPTPSILIAMAPVFLPVMPKHVYEGADMQTTDLNTSKVVGSGPFKIEKYDEGTSLTLIRNDDFFMDPAKLKTLVYRYSTDESSALLSLQRGEINMTLAQSPTALQQLQKMDGVTVADTGYEGLGNLNWVDVNTKNKYLADKRVRQALAYGMDVQAVIDQLHAGFAEVNRGPLSLESPFYSESSVENFEHDTARAEQLLDAAGYPADGDGVRFTLSLSYIPGVDTFGKNVAELLRQQWAEIGVKIKLDAPPDAATWAERVGNYQYDLNVDNVWNWGDPTIGVARTYDCENIRKGALWANMSQFCDREVDALLDDAAQATDEEARKDLYGQFQEAVTDAVPVLWIEELRTRNAYQDNVQDVPNGIWGMLSPMLETSVG